MQAQTPVVAPVALAPPPATTAAILVPVPTAPPVSVVGVDWTVLVPLIFVGVGGLVTTVFNAVQSFKNGKKSDAIHVLVNSGMTKALADLSTAQEEIRTLRELVNALNTRITGVPGVDGTLDAGATRSQQLSDQARLPSAEVLAAKASTPLASAPPKP